METLDKPECGYLESQFMYKTREECVSNYFNLGLTVAGMLLLGFVHVLVGLGMFAAERVTKHNVDAVKDASGVSGIYSALAGYLIGSWWLGKSAVFLVLGAFVLAGHIPQGVTRENAIAHGLPAFLGLSIAILARRAFGVR